MTLRRVLITAAATPLGLALAGRLADRPDVEAVVLADTARIDAPAGAKTVSLDGGYLDIRNAVGDHEIDTVVHGALSPDRLGDHRYLHEPDVITTMQIAAVAADIEGPVRNLVALSSTMRYPALPEAPLFHDEAEELSPPRDGSYAASLAEAEEYLTALAEQRPNLSVCILRLADLAGDGVMSPLGSLLAGSASPRYLGFDPRIQFLHIDDAVGAIEHAVELYLSGLFNVASRGTVRWSTAIRLSRSVPIPVLPPTLDPFTSMRRRLLVDPVPKGLSQTLRFGRVAATDRLDATGFIGARRTDECARWT